MSPAPATTSVPFFASQRRSSNGSPLSGPMWSRAAAISSGGVGVAGAATAKESIRYLRGHTFRIVDWAGGDFHEGKKTVTNGRNRAGMILNLTDLRQRLHAGAIDGGFRRNLGTGVGKAARGQ